jgi:hypothetical protein
MRDENIWRNCGEVDGEWSAVMGWQVADLVRWLP